MAFLDRVSVRSPEAQKFCESDAERRVSLAMLFHWLPRDSFKLDGQGIEAIELFQFQVPFVQPVRMPAELDARSQSEFTIRRMEFAL